MKKVKLLLGTLALVALASVSAFAQSLPQVGGGGRNVIVGIPQIITQSGGTTFIKCNGIKGVCAVLIAKYTAEVEVTIDPNGSPKTVTASAYFITPQGGQNKLLTLLNVKL